MKAKSIRRALLANVGMQDELADDKTTSLIMGGVGSGLVISLGTSFSIVFKDICQDSSY